MSDTTEAEAEPLAIESAARQRVLDVLQRELGDGVLGSVLECGDLWVRVDPSAWHRAAEVCQRLLGMRWFCFLSGIDWLPNTDLAGEKAFGGEEGGDDEDEVAEEATDDAAEDEGAKAMTTGLAGGDTRFQVLCRLADVTRHVAVNLKADLDEADPRIASLTDLFRGADWHERETNEMYGFDFEGHPGLRNLYLPTGFEGYPLRKDFPLLARELKPWPGLVNVEQIPDHLDPKKIAEADAAAEAEATEAREAAAEAGKGT